MSSSATRRTSIRPWCRLGGQVIRLSPSSTDYVNPLDINLTIQTRRTPWR